MKTNKPTKFLIILITMLLNSISYSYDVEVISPKACYDNFSFIHYPADIIHCKFNAHKVHPFDSDLITYKVYVVQNGNEFLLGTGEGNADNVTNFTVYYQNFPGFKYNEKTSIRIDVKSYETPIITYSGNGYFIAYKEFINSGNRVILNGNSQLITPNPIIVTFSSACGELASGNYIIRRTKIEFTVDGDFTDSIPEIIPSLCSGFSGSGPNIQQYWGGILLSSDTQYKFYTFTYEVYNSLGQYFGNRPCIPSEAAIVYKMVKKSNVAPVIIPPTAYPRTLYWNSNVSYINCNLFRGSEPVTYNWRSTINPLHSISLTPMGNRAKLKVNFNRSTLFIEEYHIYVSVQAVNQYGQSNWDSIKIYINNYAKTIACPNINYLIKNDTLPENSILSESYETPNESVNGKLLLENPFLDDSKKLNFRISETESDITELDKIGITQILVEKDENVAVTRKGIIVNYKAYKGKLNMVKNKNEDKTDELESDDDKFVKLDEDDFIDADFIPDGSNFIILRLNGSNFNKEKPAGIITTNEGKEFSVYAMDNQASFCLDAENYSLSSFTFKALQPVILNQVIAAKNLNTFTENILNIGSAFTDNYTDVTKTLLYSDNKSVKISRGNYIDFYFDGKLTNINKKSFFICNSRGQINTVGEKTGDESIPEEKPVTYNNLSENLPNPFNPVTKINYQIIKDGFVKLIVFDITGKEVKTIVNEFKTAGSYQVVFDGSGISSGTYFYRIETSNGFKDTKRMILIK